MGSDRTAGGYTRSVKTRPVSAASRLAVDPADGLLEDDPVSAKLRGIARRPADPMPITARERRELRDAAAGKYRGRSVRVKLPA